MRPRTVRDGLAGAERAEAALEILRRRELSGLLRAFAAAEVPVLLLKGAALAYAITPNHGFGRERIRTSSSRAVTPAAPATSLCHLDIGLR